MLLPLQKGPGNCGTAKVKTNSALIYLHNFHVVHLVTDQNGLPRWEMSHQIQGWWTKAYFQTCRRWTWAQQKVWKCSQDFHQFRILISVKSQSVLSNGLMVLICSSVPICRSKTSKYLQNPTFITLTRTCGNRTRLLAHHNVVIIFSIVKWKWPARLNGLVAGLCSTGL